MKNDEILYNIHAASERLFNKFNKDNQFSEQFKALSLEEKYGCIIWIAHQCQFNEKEKVTYFYQAILSSFFSSREEAEKFVNSSEHLKELAQKVILYNFNYSMAQN